MNLEKTTVKSTVQNVNISSDGEDSRTVTNKFLVVLITNEETKKRISLSKAEMANLTKITKDLEVSKKTQKLSYCRQQSFELCCVGAKETR